MLWHLVAFVAPTTVAVKLVAVGLEEAVAMHVGIVGRAASMLGGQWQLVVSWIAGAAPCRTIYPNGAH